jgi:uncharacterized cupredoxin-like copper-binding protein
VRARGYLLAGLATLTLTAGTMTVFAAAMPPGPAAGAYRLPGPAGRVACRLPARLPGQRVTATLADMGSMMGGGPARGGWRMVMWAAPQTVPAGQVTLVAANVGIRTHELVILPLAAGAVVGDRVVGADDTVDETGSLGEASRSCGAGEGAGIVAGSAGWVTLDLRPGRYELVCNLPGHYRAGMVTELDIE